MNRLFAVRKLAAILFAFVLGAYALTNLVYAYPTLEATALAMIDNESFTIEQKIETMETTIINQFFAKDIFVEGYGLVQTALGKEAMDDFTVVKDNQGKLHTIDFFDDEMDAEQVGDAVLTLAEAAEVAESEFLFLMPLSKTVEGYTTFDAGLPASHENEGKDALLAYLVEEGVSTLDLRDTVADSGIANADLFYDTDEHWTIQTAFWAFCETVSYLDSTYDVSLDTDGAYTALENYNQTVYQNSFLGDMGRALGSGYSGIDDFTLIYPKFSTKFQIVATDGQTELVNISDARFEGALIDVSQFNTVADIMEADADKYAAYLWGTYAFTSITNLENPDDASVLFVNDSFATPVAAFLSSTCGQVDLMNPTYYEGDVAAYIAESDYDFVIVCVSGSNLTEDYFTVG